MSAATAARRGGASLSAAKDQLRKRNRRPLPDHVLIQHWKIVKGDLVQVMTGRDAGKQGEVVRVEHKFNRLFIKGLNLVKKHVRGSEAQKGGVFQIEAPIHVSNVALVDPSDNKPAKIAIRYYQEDDEVKKVRVSKRTGLVIPKPAMLTRRRKRQDGPKDTAPEQVYGNYQPSMIATGTARSLLEQKAMDVTRKIHQMSSQS